MKELTNGSANYRSLAGEGLHRAVGPETPTGQPRFDGREPGSTPGQGQTVQLAVPGWSKVTVGSNPTPYLDLGSKRAEQRIRSRAAALPSDLGQRSDRVEASTADGTSSGPLQIGCMAVRLEAVQAVRGETGSCRRR